LQEVYSKIVEGKKSSPTPLAGDWGFREYDPPCGHFVMLQVSFALSCYGAGEKLALGERWCFRKLREDRRLKGKKLPSATTIWRYWRSFGNRLYSKRDPLRSEIKPSEIPQSMQIPGVGLVSINQARDEYGRVTVMHRAHAEPERARQLARLKSETAFQDCRMAFTEWGMPKAIQTDRTPYT